MRYLAVLQVRASADKSDYDFPVRSQDGWMTVGDWEILAEMDTSKAVAINVRHRDGSAVLAVDRSSAKLGSKRFRSRQGESLLAERVGKKMVIERSRDELPEAAR